MFQKQCDFDYSWESFLLVSSVWFWNEIYDVSGFFFSANDVTGLRESEEKLKQQQQESARRENILVMRLATKEQEMQECTVSSSVLQSLVEESTSLQVVFKQW